VEGSRRLAALTLPLLLAGASCTAWSHERYLARMGLRVAPPQIPALIAALQQKFGLDDRNITDQATMKAESKRIFNRTFSVTSALNASR